jgi:hypothetical protein
MPDEFTLKVLFLAGVLVVISLFVRVGGCFRGDPKVRSFSSYLRRFEVPLQSDIENQLDGMMISSVQALDTTTTEQPFFATAPGSGSILHALPLAE